MGGTDEPLRLLDRNIRGSITAELQRRGYAESQDGADLRIYYETASADKVETNPVQVGVGIGSWGGNFGGSVNMSSPPAGSATAASIQPPSSRRSPPRCATSPHGSPQRGRTTCS